MIIIILSSSIKYRAHETIFLSYSIMYPYVLIVLMFLHCSSPEQQTHDGEAKAREDQPVSRPTQNSGTHRSEEGCEYSYLHIDKNFTH